MAKIKLRIYYRALAAFILCIFGAVYLINRADKPKTKFTKQTGYITLFKSRLDNVQHGDDGKMRFLKLNNSPTIFGVFVGKEKGDFNPKFETVDSLKLGDLIDIYYDGYINVERGMVNQTVSYIDRGDNPIFIEGGGPENVLVYILICVCLLSITGLYFLKRKAIIF